MKFSLLLIMINKVGKHVTVELGCRSLVKLGLKRATCIKGQIWPPLEPKTRSCVSSISSNWFIRRTPQVKYPGFDLTFTVAMVTKMADEIGSE